jgi:2-hydroxychromene-2-carboxylate isomerase
MKLYWAFDVISPFSYLAVKHSPSFPIAQGVFAVRTFVIDGELFWGHESGPQGTAGTISPASLAQPA